MYQGYKGIKSSTIPIFPQNPTVVDVAVIVICYEDEKSDMYLVCMLSLECCSISSILVLIPTC